MALVNGFQHIRLSSQQIASGRMNAEERKLYEQGMHVKECVETMVPQPDQDSFKRVTDAEGASVDFRVGTQPSQSKGFRKLMVKTVELVQQAAFGLAGGIVFVLPFDVLKSTAAVVFALPTMALDKVQAKLAKDPSLEDHVYTRSIPDPKMNNHALHSETVFIHPDGSFQYFSRPTGRK